MALVRKSAPTKRSALRNHLTGVVQRAKVMQDDWDATIDPEWFRPDDNCIDWYADDDGLDCDS